MATRPILKEATVDKTLIYMALIFAAVYGLNVLTPLPHGLPSYAYTDGR